MPNGGVIFFDLTQLILRVAFPTPTGIGRVELAYANYLLANYPNRVRFIFALPRRPRFIPTRLAAKYLKEIEMIWGSKDNFSDKLEQKLKIYLKDGNFSKISRGEALGPLEERPSFRQTNPVRRLSLAADFLLNLATHNIRPLNLVRYSRSEFKNAYVSVSNSIITSRWLIRWLSKSPSVAGIFLLHDLIPITNPEFTLPRTTIRHSNYLRRLSKHADTIITNSLYTSHCLEQHAASTNLPLPKVVVSPLGVDRIFLKNRASLEPTTPYFVFTATIEPRKNHIMLLQVWQRLVAKFGVDSPKLVLVGRRGWENENTLDLIERAEVLRDYVIECGSVPDQLLIKLLAHARAALFPSHIEGFGLPLAEALAMGVPIICSDIPPFKEIAGDIPEYVDPLAGRGWLKLITEYSADNSEKRAAQLNRMKKFRAPRWEDHLSILDTVLLNTGVIADLQPKTRAAELEITKPKPIGVLGTIARGLSVLWRRPDIDAPAAATVPLDREPVLNAILATWLGGRPSEAALESIEERASRRQDIIASFRGLRCAIVGKLSDQPEASAFAIADARARIDQGIAQMAIAVVYPAELKELKPHRQSDAIGSSSFKFTVLTDVADGHWRIGGIDDILSVLRGAHELTIRDEALQQAVTAMSTGLTEISGTLIDDLAACDRLDRVLGMRNESNVRAFV
jgi:glycosyltransferase involved in cell wall biosynthesis